MFDLYGASAARAATCCIYAAATDGRDDDRQFWIRTAALVEAADRERSQIALTRWRQAGIWI
jgi:hypothetical protein